MQTQITKGNTKKCAGRRLHIHTLTRYMNDAAFTIIRYTPEPINTRNISGAFCSGLHNIWQASNSEPACRTTANPLAPIFGRGRGGYAAGLPCRSTQAKKHHNKPRISKTPPRILEDTPVAFSPCQLRGGKASEKPKSVPSWTTALTVSSYVSLADTLLSPPCRDARRPWTSRATLAVPRFLKEPLKTPPLRSFVG